mmetsp:Transcript_49622/g.117258  ORF Transcript_49622/g.117258 Transcript_49622/m.117258 type:complete len:230 (+) Transcript_49622:882-1571(+)
MKVAHLLQRAPALLPRREQHPRMLPRPRHQRVPCRMTGMRGWDAVPCRMTGTRGGVLLVRRGLRAPTIGGRWDVFGPGGSSKRARCVPSSSSSPLGRFSCFPLTPPAHMLSTQRAPPMLPSRRACCNHRAGRPHGALLRVLCCVQRVLGGVEEGVVWDVVWDEAWRAHPLRHPRICVIGVVSLPRDVPGMVYLKRCEEQQREPAELVIAHFCHRAEVQPQLCSASAARC